ncbi:copper-binding protein [Vibrio coralliilyticus OCN008]|uniref:copper-resistant cuproprotein CopI n=1 Tax=Vibrio coralliilyticus TaxID=190893 RepID=UPI0003915CFC|nr:cupredoxin family protein [Vibrio coralliilyticus]ERB65949.1 copper-binding protein [Vibrio coralliilyticus OCN008]QIJ87497.1 copper-binding protein [Vibrio coralliilyticus OCN008]
MKKTILALALTLASTQILAQMDHSSMNHSKMNMEGMDHSKMMGDMKGMDHSQMNMDEMSDVGMPAKGAKPDKVVHVILDDDMSITFKKEVDIEPNDVVQFVVMNKGKIDHEFSIGSAQEQLKHREMMKKMGNHAHDSGSTVTVAPGKAKQLLWHFHGDNNVEFACNIPGHAEAGMVKSAVL